MRRVLLLFVLILFVAVLSAGCNTAAEPAPESAPPAEGGGSITPEPSIAPDTQTNTGGELYFINVGKADAALVAVGGEYYLIDTGTKDSYPALSAALADIGVDRLRAVFITHSHDDHMGGLKKLSEEYAIGRVYCSEYSIPNKDGENKIVKKAEKLGLECVKLSAGDVVDGIFTVLAPTVYNAEDENDNSLVLMAALGEGRALFTGDMQFAEEDTLLNYGVSLKADVLKVGNHGNPDATGEEFALAVSPQFAVISTDTSVDTDSANPRVLAALAMSEVLITEDTELYWRVELN